MAYIGGVASETIQHPDPMTTTATVDLLTSPFTSRSDIGDNWSERVTYDGLNVHKMFYQNENLDARIKTQMDDWEIDYQECYLGYVPELDQFVMGFDIWMPHRHGDIVNGYGIFTFDVYHADRLWKDEVRPVNYQKAFHDGLFYHAGKADVHDQFPGILDIRLD